MLWLPYHFRVSVSASVFGNQFRPFWGTPISPLPRNWIPMLFARFFQNTTLFWAVFTRRQSCCGLLWGKFLPTVRKLLAKSPWPRFRPILHDWAGGLLGLTQAPIAGHEEIFPKKHGENSAALLLKELRISVTFPKSGRIEPFTWLTASHFKCPTHLVINVSIHSIRHRSPGCGFPLRVSWC